MLHALLDHSQIQGERTLNCVARFFAVAFSLMLVLQAPAARNPEGVPGGGAGEVKVRVASGLGEKEALQLQRYLQADGYGAGAAIELAVDGSGKYSVLIGPFDNEAQAEGLLKDLRDSGYNAEGVVQAQAVGGQVVSRAETGRVYRAQVGEFPDRAQAEGLKKSLEDDGFAAVSVLEDSGVYRVVVGIFPSETQAEEMVKMLRNEGYSLAKSIATEEVAPAVRPKEPAQIELPKEVLALPPEKQEEIRNIMLERQKAERGLLGAQELQELRERMSRLERGLQEVVKIVKTDEETKKRREEKLAPIRVKFREAILRKEFSMAEQALEEMRQSGAETQELTFFETQLNALRTSMTPDAQKAEENQKRIHQLLVEAQAALDANRLDEAKSTYIAAKAIDPANPEVKEFGQKIAEKERKLAAAPKPAGADRQLLLLYGGVGIAVILVLGLGAYVIINVRREKRILAEVQQLAGKGAAAAGEAAVATSQTTSVEQKPARQEEKEKPTPAPKLGEAPALGGVGSALAGPGALGSTILQQVTTSEPQAEEEPAQTSAPEIFRPEVAEGEVIQEQRPAGEADVLMLNDLVGASAGGESQAPPSEEIKLPDLEIPLPNLEETQTAVHEASEPSTLNLDAISSVSLDELLGASKEEKESPAPPVGAAAVSINDETTVVPSEAPSEAVAPVPPVEPTPEPALASAETTAAPSAFEATTQLPRVEAQAPAASAQDKKIIFEQTFDDEEPGTQPRGWQGEYEYATLVVDTTSPAPGSKACIKFEKRTGAGSAHYVCHFPKASGLVIVEFDIRCDEKNKYLLGFYVEKDEDFKQSVHTIIHRLDSRTPPTLRVQGEPVPYELGTWRHVKYELNLLAGTATAYVDGQEVIRDTRLASNYGYVNTLSIRDNLATTGVLYLDNIKIYQG